MNSQKHLVHEHSKLGLASISFFCFSKKRNFLIIVCSLLSALGQPLILMAAQDSAAGEEALQEFIFHHIGDTSLYQAMFITAFIILTLVFVLLFKKNPRKAPSGITNLLEPVVIFIRDDICIQYLGKKEGLRFAPFFLTLFFFILTLNLLGLIPMLATATSNVNVTGALASMVLVAMILGGFFFNGFIGFFKIFIPGGLPIAVIPIIFPLEFIGLVVKPFALTIRLFANMMAGHIIIFAILGIIVSFRWAATPLLGLGVFIYLLEVLVAFLQAYIFVMLSALFVGEMLHPSH